MNEKEISKDITLIAATSENNALGKDNQLIWHISEDLKRFKRLTQGHAVIMGRKTFESMPKALPKRTNIILTRNREYTATDAFIAHTIQEALAFTGDDKQPFIIGGGEIYTLFLEVSNTIELTRIHNSFEADAFFPAIDTTKWLLITEEKNMPTQDQPYTYSYLTYKKIS
ncbi:dihydrofolate reductase [Flavobacteriaceae bacterium]|jgi:dihydrofolate reductase|nr:dihydrofolate reductase [Flavobacteriaceae bacterium]